MEPSLLEKLFSAVATPVEIITLCWLISTKIECYQKCKFFEEKIDDFHNAEKEISVTLEHLCNLLERFIPVSARRVAK